MFIKIKDLDGTDLLVNIESIIHVSEGGYKRGGEDIESCIYMASGIRLDLTYTFEEISQIILKAVKG